MRAHRVISLFGIVVIAYAGNSRGDSSLPTLPSSASSLISVRPASRILAPPTFPPVSSQNPLSNAPGTGPGNRYIVVPGSGDLSPKSCNRTIPNGSQIDENQDVWLGGQKIQHISPCSESDIAPSSNGWVESASQLAHAHSYFEQVVVDFYVPSAPAPDGQNIVFIWSGIESATPFLLQPVLQFGQAGVDSWSMQDFVVQGTTILANDFGGAVYAGDEIESAVFIDPLEPGSSCSNGAHCNYWTAWWDVTSGHTTTGGFSFNVPEPLYWALGAVLEVSGNFIGCQDFPGDGLFGTLMTPFFDLNLWEPTGCSSPPCPDTPNLVNTPYPNAGSGTLFFENNQPMNCPFGITSGCWFGNCSAYGTALSY